MRDIILASNAFAIRNAAMLVINSYWRHRSIVASVWFRKLYESHS